MTLQSLTKTLTARRFTVLDVARAYEHRTIKTHLAVLIIKFISRPRGDAAEKPCKHGISTPLRLNDVPCCPLCMIDFGYSCDGPRQQEVAA